MGEKARERGRGVECPQDTGHQVVPLGIESPSLDPFGLTTDPYDQHGIGTLERAFPKVARLHILAFTVQNHRRAGLQLTYRTRGGGPGGDEPLGTTVGVAALLVRAAMKMESFESSSLMQVVNVHSHNGEITTPGPKLGLMLGEDSVPRVGRSGGCVFSYLGYEVENVLSPQPEIVIEHWGGDVFR